MDIKNKLQQVPTSPGIYIMKNSRESVIYVGKAKNLRSRLRSYFQSSSSLDARKSRMVEEIKDFEYVVTKNELEALVLEANFIKRTKPRYNIILRDDKNYPYLKLTVQEEWPRLEVVRNIEKDGAEYFGPYVPSGSMREMLKFIRRNFPIRRCRYNLSKTFRPCVQYQMGRCLGPCDASQRTEDRRQLYLDAVKEVRSFIMGEKKELIRSLQERMRSYSEELRFEEAAEIRDRLRMLEMAWESQRVISPDLGDLDAIGMYRESGETSLFMLFVRNGMVIGRKDFFLKGTEGMEHEEILAGFLEQFYSRDMILPPRIILPLTSSLVTQKKWLSEKRGGSVQLSYAKGEVEESVLKMANDNALYAFKKHKDKKVDEALLGIKDALGLKVIPGRISALDISNTSGAEAVGAIVVFEDGRFIKEDYRLFKIRTVRGSNDFAMVEEVVNRYVAKEGGDEGSLPDLLLIDGGRGQLESALNALQQFDVLLEVAAIAKAKKAPLSQAEGVRRDRDRIYLPGRRRPVYLAEFLASTHLLQRIRDEVHRFAISYHKKLRSKKNLSSPLEKIKGIGKQRRLILLKHFGSLDGIRKAPLDEIASLKGMNRRVAEDLKKYL